MRVVDSVHSKAIRAAFGLRYGRQAYGRYAALLEESQWWPTTELQILQMRKLTALLKHTYVHVPFYRRRFDEVGLRPEHIQSPADMVALPFLTKRDIQDNLEDLVARDVDRRRLVENHTGGSTGLPLTFYQDAEFCAWGDADKLRNYRMAGYQLGMRWAFLWGSDYDAAVHKGWRGRLQDRVIYNTLWINTFDLTLDTLVTAAEKLAYFQPQIIVAYVSSATLLARVVRDRRVSGIRPRAIQTSAEVLTPDDRALLQETFGCEIFDRYGCREVNNIAHECSAHRGLHILAENNLVEIVDANGHPALPGTVGRVVVTNLNNQAMPLIRYEVGDMAIPADQLCECGRKLPLLHSIAGRKVDVITSPSGKMLHGEFFTHLFYKIKGVYQFRVIQETRTDLHVQLVPGPRFDQQEALAFLESTIRQHGDPAFRVQFELCTYLPPAPSGKHRFTISHVPLNV
jgi:phenylacetate-CoA ligase